MQLRAVRLKLEVRPTEGTKNFDLKQKCDLNVNWFMY